MKTFLMVLGSILVSTPLMAAIGTEGHGGDPLRLLFNDARRYAVERVSHAKPCEFNVDVRPEVVEWIIHHKAELAADIGAAPHAWTFAPQSSCAFTQTQANSPVSLSFSACRSFTKDANDAITILVHESAHHLGIESETFADEVGRAIARLGQRSTCNATPSSDPFDPGSCPGRQVSNDELYSWIPLPHDNQRPLGKMQATIRQRTCYGENLCTNWEDDSKGLYVDWNNKNFPLPLSGQVKVWLKNNQPLVLVESDRIDNVRWSTTAVTSESLTTRILSGSDVGHLFLNETNISGYGHGGPEITGVVTPNCLRQLVSTNRKSKDRDGNTITVQKEMVILSHFE